MSALRPDFCAGAGRLVALVASLVLNGFFVGMFVVDGFRHQRRGFSGERFATLRAAPLRRPSAARSGRQDLPAS